MNLSGRVSTKSSIRVYSDLMICGPMKGKRIFEAASVIVNIQENIEALKRQKDSLKFKGVNDKDLFSKYNDLIKSLNEFKDAIENSLSQQDQSDEKLINIAKMEASNPYQWQP